MEKGECVIGNSILFYSAKIFVIKISYVNDCSITITLHYYNFIVEPTLLQEIMMR